MPLPLAAIMGIGQAAGGLIGGVMGMGQKRRGKKILNDLDTNPAYDYHIPDEIAANQRIAQAYSNQGLPLAQYNQAMQNIGRNQNFAMGQANDRRGGLAAVAGVQQNTNDANLNLDVANSTARMNNISRLMQMNNIMGSYRDRAFDWNVARKVNQKQQYGMGLLQAGTMNQMNGIDNLVGAGMSFGSAYGKGSGDGSQGSGDMSQQGDSGFNLGSGSGFDFGRYRQLKSKYGW